jgi:DNA-binding NarL/FixJ family response regulator/Tfp pilus assembly protein PilF
VYDFRNKSALIIDDLSAARTSLRINLSNLGFESAPQVSSIREALEKLRQFKPDIIVCDYYLGDDIDGQQFLEYVRINNLISPSVAFVMVTAESTYARVASAAEYAPDVYLLKPFTAEALGQRLSMVMEQRETLAPLEKKMKSGQFVDALKAIDVMLETPTVFKVALLKLKGECLGHQDQQVAAEFYEPLAEKGVPWAISGLAKACIANGNTEKARDLLSEVVESTMPYIEAYDMLASISSPEDALMLHQKSSELIPSANRLRKVAEVALETNAFEIAEDSFKRAISKSKYGITKPVSDNTGYIKALVGSGKVEIADKEIQSLKKSLQKLTLPIADQLHLATAEAHVHVASGNTESAEACIKQAINITKNLSPAQTVELASLAKNAGMEDTVSSLLTTMIANSEGDEKVKQALQRSQFSDEYERLVAMSNEKIVEINNRAVRLAREGNYAEAYALLEDVAKTYHSNATVLYNAAKIGLAMISSGDASPELRETALHYLKAGLRVDPNHKVAAQSVEAFRKHGFTI